MLSSSGTEQSGLSSTTSTAEERSETTPPRLRQSAQNLHAIGQPPTVTPNLQAVTPQPATPSGSKGVQRAASLPATPAEPVARGVANIGEGVRIEAGERNAGKRVKYSQSERVPNRLVLILLQVVRIAFNCFYVGLHYIDRLAEERCSKNTLKRRRLTFSELMRKMKTKNRSGGWIEESAWLLGEFAKNKGLLSRRSFTLNIKRQLHTKCLYKPLVDSFANL